MSAPITAPAPGQPENLRPCPACLQPVPRKARRCHHCGETIRAERVSWWRHLGGQCGAFLGIATAVLSLVYALREGYFWVSERQAQRATVDSYRAVAARFEEIDNLDYAEHALRTALALRPDDTDLRRQHFLLATHMRLRELEGSPERMNDERQAAIRDLVLEGFRILEFTGAPPERARVLTAVGRLLQQDLSWTDRSHIGRVFEEACGAAPADAEAVFRHGQWLAASGADAAAAEASLRRATQLDPDNALYWHALGEHLGEQRAYREAFAAHRTAAALGPRQREQQRVRAANTAAADLGLVLRAADAAADITTEEFLGMSMAERRAALDLALEASPGSRDLHFVAARFFHAAGDLERARSEIRQALWNPDLDRLNFSDPPRLELYAQILEATGDDAETAARVAQLLQEYADRVQFDQLIDIQPEGKPRYRIGLRVHAEASGDGVLVDRVFARYPFAKAGVLAGDRILSLAHTQPRNLGDISRRILSFDPGAELPLQVERDGETIDLTLVVE